MTRLDKARRAAETTAIDPYRPIYHAAPTTGWMNDPNGLIWFGGKAHLFYQYYPYAPKWGKMHWGHMVSGDLVRWEHLPVALAPDQSYERLLGCFSGSAIEHNGKLCLLYTGVSLLGGQQQCLAVSENGIDFEKMKTPVILKKQLPKGTNQYNFRDPKVFRIGELFYCIIGSCKTVQDRQQREIACYTSDDLQRWDYRGAIWTDEAATKDLFECPDLFSLDRKDILIASSMNHYPPMEQMRFQNLHPCVYLVGRFDPETCRFTAEGTYEELDTGLDFYAPQTLLLPDGRNILIAWKQMWKRTIPEINYGRAGAMTFPRELSLESGKLIQKPLRELERYRGAASEYVGVSVTDELSLAGVSGNCLDLLLEVDLSATSQFNIRLFQGKAHETLLSFDRKQGICTLDRSRSGEAISSTAENDVNVRRARFDSDGILEVRILLDVSSLELFLNGGRTLMSANVYPDAEDTGITFSAQGTAVIHRIVCYPIML